MTDLGQKVNRMTDEDEIQGIKDSPIIHEIIELERSYFFEKRNVKSARQKKLRELIERHTKPGDKMDDT